MANSMPSGYSFVMKPEEGVEDGNGELEPTVESRRTAIGILVGNRNGQFTHKQGLNTLTPQVYNSPLAAGTESTRQESTSVFTSPPYPSPDTRTSSEERGVNSSWCV